MKPEGAATISVVKTAIPMPIMPNLLPWRELAGDDRPRRARINRTPEVR